MRRILTLIAGAIIVVLGAIFGRMILQPGPYGFAGGNRVDLASYKGASPTGSRDRQKKERVPRCAWMLPAAFQAM